MNAHVMRAKMKVNDVIEYNNVENVKSQETLKLTAVGKDGPYGLDGSDENNTFARYTPSADMSISIMNPALFGQFAIGDVFYLDFVRAVK